MAEAEDPGPLVVNVAHLMAYVDEQRAAGNTAFKRKQYPAALAAWQRALDACEQADGKPMMVEDVQTVLHARAILHSNRGQALIDQEWWRRAVTELDEAVRIDPTNAKALWRRYRCHRQLKAWALAEADLEALLAPELQAAAGPLLEGVGLGPEQLAQTQEELRAKREAAEAAAAETFDERVEEAAAKGIEQLRGRFEEVTQRTGLHGNKELAGELADMLTRPGGVSTQHVANVYQIDDDDAAVLVEWIQTASRMHTELGSSRVSPGDIGL